LGELYFFQQAKTFSKLMQSQISNNEHVFTGSLLPGFQELFELDNSLVQVEIKTKHTQVGELTEFKF